MVEGGQNRRNRGALWKLAALMSIGLTCSAFAFATDVIERDQDTGSPIATHQPTIDDPITISSDRNLAESMLYQWWGPFEAPDGKAFLPFVDDIFAPDVELKMGPVELLDREAIRASLEARPLRGGTSHQMSKVEVTALGEGLFQLDSDFVYQVHTPDGSVQAGHSSYRHTVEKQADGTFRFKTLTAQLGEPITGVEYIDTYALHRAQGAIVQYLGITDLLESDYIRLQQVLSDEATIMGMFDPSQQTFNERGDGALIGFDEISHWLSSRKKNFAWVAHQLKTIEVTSLGDNLFEAATEIAVQAQPHSGAMVAVTLPITITLDERGGRFMKITRILR